VYIALFNRQYKPTESAVNKLVPVTSLLRALQKSGVYYDYWESFTHKPFPNQHFIPSYLWIDCITLISRKKAPKLYIMTKSLHYNSFCFHCTPSALWPLFTQQTNDHQWWA